MPNPWCPRLPVSFPYLFNNIFNITSYLKYKWLHTLCSTMNIIIIFTMLWRLSHISTYKIVSFIGMSAWYFISMDIPQFIYPVAGCPWRVYNITWPDQACILRSLLLLAGLEHGETGIEKPIKRINERIYVKTLFSCNAVYKSELLWL